jgi:hypothetical protein
MIKSNITLKDYYDIIKNKFENGDYEPKENNINPHLESINYILWEFMSDRKDSRINKVFDKVYIPYGVNNDNIDIDFSEYDVEAFLKEVLKLKD